MNTRSFAAEYFTFSFAGYYYGKAVSCSADSEENG